MASDGVFNLYEGNTVTWGREEALASVQAAVFLDLPAPSPELAAQWRAAAPTLSQRVRAEFLSLKARPPSARAPARPSWACSRLAAAGLHAWYMGAYLEPQAPHALWRLARLAYLLLGHWTSASQLHLCSPWMLTQVPCGFNSDSLKSSGMTTLVASQIRRRTDWLV